MCRAWLVSTCSLSLIPAVENPRKGSPNEVSPFSSNSQLFMHTLTLFYDARCGLCSQVRQWLLGQPAYVRLEFVSYDSPEAARRFPAIRHMRADQEIVVMSDTGDVWQGAAAWVMCLWALEEYRAWSARLATPSMQAIARTVVHWISSHRIGLSRLMGFKSDADLQEAARSAVITSATTCTLRHDLDLLD